jgi:hypothetical protein
MRGEARRERYATLAHVAPDGRGRRFARRLARQPGPDFADLAKLPGWLSASPEERRRVAALAGLLRHRAAIDAELSGPRLAMIAETLGEALLDAACEAEMPAGLSPPAPLPPPERLVAEGEALLEAGLPACFAARFPGARDDAEARAIVARASAIAESLA